VMNSGARQGLAALVSYKAPTNIHQIES